MKHTKRAFLALLLCAALILSQAVYALAADFSDELTVSLYTTNDIHGVVEESETAIGMATVAGIAASTENALLIDAGDATQGASFATVTQGQDVIRMMNAAGYDVMAAGNHDFDYGTEQLLKNSELAEFPILSANTLKDGKLLLKDNATVQVDGKKIGFIGLTTTNTASSTNPAQLQGITFEDEVSTAKEQIAKLRDETDALVLVCHMGDNDLAVDCTSIALLDELSEDELSAISAVIDGHSHTLEDGTYGDTGIPVIQTGTGFQALGVIELKFQNGEVKASGRVMDYEEAKNFQLTQEGTAAAQKVTDTLEEIKNEQKDILGQFLCTTETPLWGGYIYYDYAEPRIVETNYGDFVTDAFASSASLFASQNNLNLPIIAVENGGGISAAMPYGKVTAGDVLNAFNHGNMVDVIKVTPAQLFTALEAGLFTTGQDDTGLLLRERVSGSFLQVSGFKYTYDPSGAAGSKVTEVILDNGTALSRSDNQSFLLLATNNYVAAFDAFADAEKLGELGGEDLILESYIQSKTNNGTMPLSVPTTANRIRIANDKSPETYEVRVPVFDKNVEKDAEPVTLKNREVHIRIDDSKAQAYVTDKDGCISLKLAKGPHTIYMEESADNQPVYVNNYSGSGTVTTAPGYYRLGFEADPDAVHEPSETPAGTNQPNPPSTGDFERVGLPLCLAIAGAAIFAASGVCVKRRDAK